MAESGNPAPLPAPNVKVKIRSDGVQWTVEQVRALRSNPLYAGIGPFAPLVSDEVWVRSAAEAIRDDGAEQFLVNLLYVLRNSIQFPSDAKNSDQSDQLDPKDPKSQPADLTREFDGLDQSDRDHVLQELKAHQRIYTITNNAIPAREIWEAGFQSATDVALARRQDFASEKEPVRSVSTPDRPVTELRVAFTARHYKRLVSFYCDGLGLETTQVWTGNQGRAVILDMGQATLEIFDEEQANTIDQLEAAKRISGQIRFALQVPDLKVAMERLLSRGATLVHPPVVTPWGDYNVRLEDPEGMQVTLFQRLEQS
jgi:uncharacterized glyoxalase superfamily protein PhnB